MWPVVELRLTIPCSDTIVELKPDPSYAQGWTLLVDGVEQSYVDVARPRRLSHSYMRWVASIVDTAAKPGTPLRVLHLGGGALTLPRYVEATRPGSSQRVVERHAALDALVREALPLPPGADIRTVIGDAREAVEAAHGPFDVIVNDVYDGAVMPESVASGEFVRHVARLLNPAGSYVVNVTDLPPVVHTKVLAATLRVAFADVCAIGESGMFRGRRYGNVVLAASAVPLSTARIERIGQITARDRVRVKVLHAGPLDDFIGGALPMTERR